MPDPLEPLFDGKRHVRTALPAAYLTPRRRPGTGRREEGTLQDELPLARFGHRQRRLHPPWQRRLKVDRAFVAAVE
ncbi:MAG: hypothetical protein ACK56I_17230 [bacterium]